MKKALATVTLALFFCGFAFAITKQQYGGTIKVAGELLDATSRQTISDLPLSYRIKEGEFSMDLHSLNPDFLTELEKSIQSLQDESNHCHWILDYPYLDHSHHTVMALESAQLILRASDATTLNTILESACLFPEPMDLLRPFRSTQFSYEANPNAIAGRPFLDSITPVQVDPLNPYLSFKLGDVDVIPVPEDRFSQIASDPELILIEASRTLLFLQTHGLSPDQVSSIVNAINPAELSRAVLNDHAEILLQVQPDQPSVSPIQITFVNLPELPYQLLGDRIQVQLQEHGVQIKAGTVASVELRAVPLTGMNPDLAEYGILRNWKGSSLPAGDWKTAWQEYTASGKIVPLMIHTSRIAVRKKIQDLHVESNGFLDFANCWLAL